MASTQRPRRSSPPPAPPLAPTRQRRPVPACSGDDPVAALAALRTLLAHTARTRFRMTPDEHRQALHLLSALEPAVVRPNAGGGVTGLATELLDEIVFHLDSARDLYALGATCQRLHGVVFPRHVEYRVVRCRPSAAHVWRHLAAHPLLARNVRRLHIMDERSRESDFVPTRAKQDALDSDASDAEGIEMHAIQKRLILSALAQMTTLTAFSWACNSSLVSFEDIAPTLFMCPSLREVEITDNLLFNPPPADEGSRESTVDTPDLTSVAINSARNTFRATKHPSLARVQGLLVAHCPSLTTLRVGYDHRRPFIPRADDFLLHGRWPGLRTLSLTNLWCSPAAGYDAAAAFLAAHPLVETLHFELGRVQLDLPTGTLPRLRELVCGRDVAAAILACPLHAGQTRPVEILRGVRIGGGRDSALMLGLRRCSRLKRIELQGYGEVDDVKRLAEAAPKVSWLDVGKRSSGPAKLSAAVVPSVNEWAPVLSALPELTAFHGVHFFYEVVDADAASQSDRSRIKKNDEVASMLAWKCPKLRRVDCWDSSGRVVVLGKEGEKFKWEVRRAAKA